MRLISKKASQNAKCYPVSLDKLDLYAQSKIPELSKRVVVPVVYQLNGVLNVATLRQAIDHIIDRHEILRTHVVENEMGEVFYKTYDKKNVGFCLINKIDKNFDKNALNFWLKVQIKKISSNIVNKPLFKITLIQLADDVYYFVIIRHHLISDGESLSFIIDELNQIYFAMVNDHEIALEKPRQHFDFLVDQQAVVDSGRPQQYWEQKASLINTCLKRSSVFMEKFKLEKVEGVFSGIEHHLLVSFSKKHNISLFSLLFSIFNLSYLKFNQKEELVVYVPVSARKSIDYSNHTMGNCVNALLAYCRVQNKQSFIDFVTSCQRELADIKSNAGVSFFDIVSMLSKQYLNSDQSWPVAFSKSVGLKSPLNLLGVKSKLILYNNDFSTQANIAMEVETNSDDKISYVIRYNKNIFSENNIVSFFKTFCSFIHFFVKNPNALLSLSDHKNLYFSQNISLLSDRLEKVFNLFSEYIAVEDGRGNQISYFELNKRANCLVTQLGFLDIKRGNRVVILLDCSIDYVVSVVACMKLGVTYIPVSPELPQSRINYIIEDSGAVACLSLTEVLFDRSIGLRVIFLDELSRGFDDNLNYPIAAESADIAYIIYTSGTTGQPKGVMVSQKNLASLFEATDKIYDINEKDVVAAVHTVSFDFSVWEIWSALVAGAKIAVFSKKDVVQTGVFFSQLVSRKVTVLNQTPTSFYRFTDYVKKNNAFSKLNLRLIILGGEALKPALLNPWLPQLDHVRICNMYGITEGTIHCTYKWIDPCVIQNNASNIGKPLPGAMIEIVNQELYIGGGIVARGYINRPYLTHQKFVNIPGKEGLWLKTGDLVRQFGLDDLEYLCRSDRQVSLRGYRIELQEIESIILDCEYVENVHVFLHKINDDDRLICFVIFRAPKRSIEEFISYLHSKLPSYMVPSHIYTVESFPLTINGKINEHALVEGVQALLRPVKQRDDISKNNVSDLINLAWDEVLGVSVKDRDINFFDAGGHSILLGKLQDKLSSILKKEIAMTDLFEHPTINAFSEWVRELEYV